MTAEDRRRIDKWLWYARLAKTRTAAQALATSGRVRVNSVKNDSASRPLKTGDVLFIPAGVIHSARNVGTERGKELATYIVEKGKPLLTVAK